MAAVATQVEVLSRQQVDTGNKLTMIVFSGEMDRAIAAFNIATGAAASGMAGRMFKQMMKSHNATPVAELRALATDLGVKMLACQMSMDVMEIGREQLIDDVQGVAGVAAMLEEAAHSKITLFI